MHVCMCISNDHIVNSVQCTTTAQKSVKETESRNNSSKHNERASMWWLNLLEISATLFSNLNHPHKPGKYIGQCSSLLYIVPEYKT